MRKNIFACLFSVHNTISLHVMNKYVSLNILVHDVINLLYYKNNIYIWKTKFTSHQQNLFGLLFYRNTKKTHTDQNIIHVS